MTILKISVKSRLSLQGGIDTGAIAVAGAIVAEDRREGSPRDEPENPPVPRNGNSLGRR